ncbi:MAG: thioredoxin family protein [Armatimonadetes bacterium]|nr:thioredoxin family protein [Armatimonadota bacterium]
MLKARLLIALAMLSVPVLSAAQGLAFSGPGGQPVVKLTAKARNKTVAPGDATVVAVRLNVLNGFHIQSNKPSDETLIPTVLEVRAPASVRIKNIVYPTPKQKAFSFSNGKQYPVYEDGDVILVKAEVTPTAPQASTALQMRVSYQGCTDEQCYPPDEATSKVQLVVGPETSAASTEALFREPEATVAPDLQLASQSNPFAGVVRDRGWVILFALVFGAGLLLSLTPCVFPLIPVTLGYFQGQASDSRARLIALAITYVAGLCTTYSILGFAAATSGALFGSWLSNPWVLGTFAVIIAAMGLSMLGLYELKPPAFLASKSGAKAGYGGAFVMGLLFGVVAAPCTGPATIALLTFVGQLARPMVGLLLFFVLALGITTPLLALAIFSGSLPRSGAWMEWVKHFMGVLMLGAAVYFLRTVTGLTTASYMMGALAIGAGLWLAFVEHSGWKPVSLAVVRVGAGTVLVLFGIAQVLPKGAGIEWEPYAEARIQQAAEKSQPVIIDFGATWCAACEELKEGAFRDPKVVALSRDFVRLSFDATDSRSERVKEVQKRFGVRGLPTVIFLGPNGKEAADRVLSNVPPSRLLERMHKTRGSASVSR